MIVGPKKVVLITGGSRGIGRAICERFSKPDFIVLFLSKAFDGNAQSTCSSLASSAYQVRHFPVDVLDRDALRYMFEAIEAEYGLIDILINNAGVNKPTDFEDVTEEDWDFVVDTNLKGIFNVTQLAFPLLKKSSSASIVHVGSVSGQYGGPRTVHYACSKAGLISLSQVVARCGAEFGIRSNVVAAGLIDSDMANAGLAHGAVGSAASNILLGRLGTSREVADACFFLASEESRYVTAQTLNVNGGLYF